MLKLLTVTEESKGTRLDIAVAEQLASLSRAYVRKLIEQGRVLVNGAQEKPGYRLKPRDTITTDFEESELEQVPEIDLPVLYEDADVIVINKPPGVISHSRGRYWNEPSVASFVRQKTQQEGQRAGIVHRLDRATSGVMICAKNQAALSHLQKQFSGRSVKKTYTAVVSGHLSPPEAIIDMPIERNPKAPATFRVGANGKPSATKYKVIEQREAYELINLEPVTGRTHQLRVHLAHQNHPIVGDVLYGGEPAERLYLHATSLELTLPSGQARQFTAPLPDAFKNIGRTA